MLEKILKLYVMAMAYDVRSPMPHLFGPPGCGKSTFAEQAADLLGVNLHIINVSRISPLEIEGVQMPHGTDDEMVLRMLPATFWTSLRKGDIVLLDEFLRGFPEVYNALLDILTSRRAGAFALPHVFIMAASNSTVAYDKALEDRLLHIPVPDPRKSKAEKTRLGEIIVNQLGLMPDSANCYEMQSLLDAEVLPMYDILDQIKGRGSSSPAAVKGCSVRNLIGQAQLREIKSSHLIDLINMNNQRAAAAGKHQYVLLTGGKPSNVPSGYEVAAAKLLEVKHKLTETQVRNLELNLQLIQLESIRNEQQGAADDVDDIFTDLHE